jgi:non-homologous end joining protein Ku
MATKTKPRAKNRKNVPSDRGRRPIWSGFLRVSLVTVPLKAYTANAPGLGEIHLHQIHKTCHSRIKYQKTCPIHGPVSNDEIVSGFEISKGHYVEIDPDELDQLRSESDKPAHVINLMDALKKSVALAQESNGHAGHNGKPPRKMAQSSRHAAAGHRKRA